MLSCLRTTNQSFCNWYNEISTINCFGQKKRNSVKKTFDVRYFHSKALDVDTLTTLHENNPLLKYLFTHNGFHYYGNREIVHNSMIKKCSEYCNDYELDGNVPQYIVIQYIKASYFNTFDLNDIKPIDFMNFLDLVEKNPTTVLSIDKMDCQIVKYIDKNNMISESELETLKILCQKYGLKYTSAFINSLD